MKTLVVNLVRYHESILEFEQDIIVRNRPKKVGGYIGLQCVKSLSNGMGVVFIDIFRNQTVVVNSPIIVVNGDDFHFTLLGLS